LKKQKKINWELILLPGDTKSIESLENVKQIDSNDFRHFSKSLDEHRYLEIFKVASDEKVEK
jgi:hypothetical protein